MRNARIYIDQNIVGYVHDESLNLHKVKGVDWVYSNEHFNEISRSGDTTFLSAFEKLKAQQIEIVLDDKFRITDKATLHPYSSPYERYERYIETTTSIKFDDRLFTDFLGRLLGADNYQELKTLPERFKLQIEALLHEAGIPNEYDQNSIEHVSGRLDEIIKNDLSETRTLESMRKSLGTDSGKIGSSKTENPIQEIWEIIRSKVGNLTSDQFFGFEPLDKQGYGKWPMYLGIVACHIVLNFVGYRTDKGIAVVENLPNIMSDANHIAIAAFCDAVMSENKRFCKKASAIYKYKNHHTQVLHLEIQNSS